MRYLQGFSRAAFLAVGAFIGAACSESTPQPLTAPPQQARFSASRAEDVRAAIAAQEKYNPALLSIPGVVGTAVGLSAGGRAVVRVFLVSADVRAIPPVLDGIPVEAQVTGLFVALSDPTTRQRPAPLGFSVGHPAITAGSIGARVVDPSGFVYVLSNNHVLANSNDASIGDASLQPGPYDGGTAADQIATLYAFKPINFSGGSNTFDAAIARSNTADLGNGSPTDDGYGTPSAAIFGDANGDGTFDDKTALLGVAVQKYGRTTKLTKASISGINGSVTVCYEVFLNFCLKAASYVDQLIIQSNTFSGGGDSGSLIVTDNADKNPVALLFAGSSTQTIANRIDLVLNYFGVHVDGSAGPPPPPLTDVGINSVSGPSSITRGGTATISVAVKNVGNQSVPSSFDVTLRDATDNVVIGTQTVAGLAAGASTTLSFAWNTTSSTLGTHTLTAAHTLADDNAANNQASTNVQVNDPSTSLEIHIGDLDGTTSNGGSTWSATVEITVHDANHNPLNGATITGKWSVSGLNSDTCTSGELGGNGTCIVLFPSLKKSVRSVVFTVTNVTMSARTYQPTANHDVDGSSNGTSITVNKP